MTKSILTYIITTISIGVLLLSCQENVEDVSRNKYLDQSINVNEQNIPIDSNQNYYPYEVFTDTSIYKGSDKFLVNWFSEHLFAMREPLLFNKKTEKESYRFLWLRTFHNPIAIRIEKNGTDIRLYWKQCDGAGGYEPGKLILNKSKKLTAAHWNTFTSKIDAIDFWNAKVNDNGGNDGSEWILEGATPTHYNVIYRWSPRNGGLKDDEREKYYEMCKYLIELADLNIADDLIY